MGFFDKLKKGLTKTCANITGKIEKLIVGYADIDDDLLDELEEILIMADVGVNTTDRLMTAVRKGQEGEEKLEKMSQSDEPKPSIASTQATKAPKTPINSKGLDLTDRGVNLVATAVAERNKQEAKKKTPEAKITKTKNKITK